ncbi:hypothetical protein L596_029702 [Steinernema carpocapsae]|uniref:Uncharacterized protein n=1 Tax=Steinernema carpocapsae TaxID=34508 RepID=A0A4U5LQK4_STECR|nr:hypothetical protein L596_029702 [Steinernema carpocapsae]
MQQRIQMPQPSPGPVMYAAPSMDMNGYAAVYSYQAAFQQPPPQQFIQAEQAYQNSSQFNMPPPGMYSAAQAAQAYQQRPPPQQQQTFYAALPHPSMMQHQEQQRNPFMAPGKHCLSVFDTPAESSAAYTASWVSSTSSIPPEQKASPDQESNPPTPSEYSNNWHENNVHRASPLVDEFAAGASATSGFSPPLGDNTLDAQLASLNISHADFTATINGKGPMPSGFYGARTVNAPQMHQNQGIPMHHSMAPPQMGQASYLTTAAMYYQSGPPQPHNANYYVANQPPPTQHVVDVSGNTWADMVKKGGNCSVGETRIRQMQTQRQDSMSQNQGNQGQGHPGHNGHNRRFNRRQNPGGNNCYQNGRNNFNNQQNLQQNARKNRMERMDRNSQEQFMRAHWAVEVILSTILHILPRMLLGTEATRTILALLTTMARTTTTLHRITCPRRYLAKIWVLGG